MTLDASTPVHTVQAEIHADGDTSMERALARPLPAETGTLQSSVNTSGNTEIEVGEYKIDKEVSFDLPSPPSPDTVFEPSGARSVGTQTRWQIPVPPTVPLRGTVKRISVPRASIENENDKVELSTFKCHDCK